MLDCNGSRPERQDAEGKFLSLKRISSLKDLWIHSVPLDLEAGYLLPVCDLHLEDTGLIETFSRWREEQPQMQDVPAAEGLWAVREWLHEHVLSVPTRLLWLVVDSCGQPIGHLRLDAHLGEVVIDHVHRGSSCGHHEIMRLALRAVVDWCETNLKPHSYTLQVLSGMKGAAKAETRFGFVEFSRVPVVRMVQNGVPTLVPVQDGNNQSPDDFLVTMKLRASSQLLHRAAVSLAPRPANQPIVAIQRREWQRQIERYEEAFAKAVQRKYAIATTSSSGALYLSLLAMRVGPGDEVILPELANVSIANAVLHAGAVPVFADVDPFTWCLDPASLEAQVTPATKAVIAVHLHGHPARMDKILDIATTRGLAVLEDVSSAVGAEYEGRRVGSQSDFACFGFRANSLTGRAEGGIMVTDDSLLYERALSMWERYRDPRLAFWTPDDSARAAHYTETAFDLARLHELEAITEAKRRIRGYYDEELSDIRGIDVFRDADYARGVCWTHSIQVSPRCPISRDYLCEMLRKQDIEVRSALPPLSQYPVWPRTNRPHRHAHNVSERALHLPSGSRLTRENVRNICREIRNVVGTAGSIESAA